MTTDPNTFQDNRVIIDTSPRILTKDEDINRNERQMSEELNDANLNSDNSSNFEWEYSMRRQMQQIIPHLWLGPYASALKGKAEELSRVGITHIICVRQQIESHWIRPNFADKYHYLTLDIADSPTQNIIQYFPIVTQFIDECFAQKGAVLVHGNAGISRSAALVIAYIMEKKNLTANHAIRVVQSRRFCIFPNEGFRQQLQEYEPILQAKGIPLTFNELSIKFNENPVINEIFEPKTGGLKRPLSDEDYENMDTNQIPTHSMDS